MCVGIYRLHAESLINVHMHIHLHWALSIGTFPLTESTRALLWTAGVWMYVVVGVAPADQSICTTQHCSHWRVIASPLGQSVTLTQALASSSSTVPSGHSHPLRHSKVQTLVGSSQVPVQGTQESTPSKYSSPCNGHSAGMVHIKYKLYDWSYSRTHYIFTGVTHIKLGRGIALLWQAWASWMGAVTIVQNQAMDIYVIYECWGEDIIYIIYIVRYSRSNADYTIDTGGK